MFAIVFICVLVDCKIVFFFCKWPNLKNVNQNFLKQSHKTSNPTKHFNETSCSKIRALLTCISCLWIMFHCSPKPARCAAFISSMFHLLRAEFSHTSSTSPSRGAPIWRHGWWLLAAALAMADEKFFARHPRSRGVAPSSLRRRTARSFSKISLSKSYGLFWWVRVEQGCRRSNCWSS